METRKIGSLQVSVLGLGRNNFGWRIHAAASAAVVDAAIDSGINFFDTADRYGKKVFTKKNLAVIEALIDFATKRGRTILQLAFSWLLAHKPIASVLADASKPEQVRANAAAANWQLTSAELAEIDSIVQGAG